MIIVYPMLISNNIQSNVLPGVAKTLEKYTLLYKMDDIVNQINLYSKKGKRVSRRGSILKLSENIENDNLICGGTEDSLIEGTEDSLLEQGTKHPSSAIPVTVTTGGGGGSKSDGGIVKFDIPNLTALSLEPTWIKIDTPLGTRIVGIKVVPFPVRSDEKLINLITHDRYMKILPAMLTTVGRKILKYIWATIRWSRLPFTQLSISGDPKKDIIFARTVHRDDIFLAMNLIDVGSEFFEKTRNIKWMHKSGWSSFVITDDINKFAYFCMKEFHGMCSMVQYNFMYTTVSKEQGRVFEDMEDVKKSSSPFFRLSKRSTEIVGEKYASHKLSKFLVG